MKISIACLAVTSLLVAGCSDLRVLPATNPSPTPATPSNPPTSPIAPDRFHLSGIVVSETGGPVAGATVMSWYADSAPARGVSGWWPKTER